MKEKILEILNNNVGKSVSGQLLAQSLGISRNSVWKIINKLKEDGYNITSQTNAGYTLNASVDIFTENSINSHLKNEHKIIIYDKETSSNTVAKRLASEGADEGTVVIVNSQTAGRGRMGRRFISESDNGLYMSIILRPQISASECVNITVLSAVAVCEAIEETSGRGCQIKWVNDIYIKDKKVCGILTEATMDFELGKLDYAIVGIGVNLSAPKGGFDKEIENIATAIYENKRPCGYKARLCAKIIEKLFEYYPTLTKKDYIKKYREKSNLIGKEVNVYIGNEIESGTVTDIDENASLVVATKGGIKKYNSGEARVRKNESD